jgi:hypothetical protein
MQFQDELAAGVVLVRPAFQSPDYVEGVSGWAIFIDGSAEFNNLTVRGTFLGSDFILDSTGLYVYSGTPALGNLVASISVGVGTDTFGNVTLDGVVSYDTGGVFASLSNSNLLIGEVANYLDAGLVGLSGSGTVFMSSPTTGADAATIALINGSTAVTPLSAAGYPHVDIGAATAGLTAWINGALIRSTVNGGVSTAETWHAPSYGANWSGTTTFGTISGGLGTLRYRMDAEDNLWILGTAVAAAGASTTLFNMAAPYRPKTNYPFPVAWISSGGVAGNAWAYVSTAGNLNLNSQLGSAVTAGTAYTFNGKIPLGNVA